MTYIELWLLYSNTWNFLTVRKKEPRMLSSKWVYESYIYVCVCVCVCVCA